MTSNPYKTPSTEVHVQESFKVLKDFILIKVFNYILGTLFLFLGIIGFFMETTAKDPSISTIVLAFVIILLGAYLFLIYKLKYYGGIQSFFGLFWLCICTFGMIDDFENTDKKELSDPLTYIIMISMGLGLAFWGWKRHKKIARKMATFSQE